MGLGVLFILLGTVICLPVFRYDHKIETTGVITEIIPYHSYSGDTDYHVYVSYRVGDKEYESELNSYSSSFYEGSEIPIYYDEKNPNKIGVKSLDLLVLLFPGFGLLFLIIGGVGIWIKKYQKKRENKLKTYVEKVEARYLETVLNRGYRLNGRYPYNIICEWDNPIDHKKYIFKSKNLWFDPVNLIQENKITTFFVYLDRKNIKRYVIDIDFLVDKIVDLR